MRYRYVYNFISSDIIIPPQHLLDICMCVCMYVYKVKVNVSRCRPKQALEDPEG
jgi:hypothetical protein